MRTNFVIDIVAGCAAVVATTVASVATVDRVSDELKENVRKKEFFSPEGNNCVLVSYAVSKTAGSLTYVTVKAATAEKEECREFSFWVKKRASLLGGGWIGNDKFRLLIGQGKRKHYCDVHFVDGKILADHSRQHITWKVL